MQQRLTEQRMHLHSEPGINLLVSVVLPFNLNAEHVHAHVPRCC